MNAKFQDEIKNNKISEKVYFEKYLQISQCVRDFILRSDSFYFKEYFRGSNTRKSNFNIDYESSDDEDEADDDLESYHY
ncbi:unnamed protein product [Brachionus calyciflorus]|uniref:Uncharacterized protein n=1 Tax=Brachionus calyciflorus TaxID=104777 RepID=A0A814F1R0_9BILA|nr:unnamed protein product [Brachionus calyciflorus]